MPATARPMMLAAASFCQTPCWRNASHSAAVAAVTAIATERANRRAVGETS